MCGGVGGGEAVSQQHMDEFNVWTKKLDLLHSACRDGSNKTKTHFSMYREALDLQYVTIIYMPLYATLNPYTLFLNMLWVIRRE